VSARSKVLVAHVDGRCYLDLNRLQGSSHILVMDRDVMLVNSPSMAVRLSLGAARARLMMRAQCALANPMDDDGIRAAVVQYCISSTEIINRMRKLQFCAGREEEMVYQMLAGGECSLGVALAVCSIIGCETATIGY
jgi:hypothetical protein